MKPRRTKEGENTVKKIMAVLALITALGGAAAVVASLDGRYAKSDHLSAVEDRLDRKIVRDRMEKIQERLWAIEDRWAELFKERYGRIHDTLEELLHFMTEEARDQYRRLQKEYEELEARLREEESEDEDG